MNGYYEKGKLKGKVNTYGAMFYLIVKNERDFFKGVYFNEDTEASQKKEVVLENFTGKLLLTNLTTTGAFLIKYKDGKVVDNLSKAQKIASAKLMSAKGTVSYRQTQCHTEMRYCVYASDGYSYCGGAIDIIVSYNYQWPSAQCGVSYYMIDNAEEQICEDYWYPDPPEEPTNPNDGDGTTTDGNPGTFTESEISDAQFNDDGKPKIADIRKYTNCFNDGKQVQSYTMTVFVDQPVAGQSDWFKVVVPSPGTTSNNPYGVPTGVVWTTAGGTSFDVGHTFVTFEKNNTDGTNVRQTLGFYPSSNPFRSEGAMENNSLHEADVSYTVNVTQAQFNAALAKVEDDFDNKKYILTNINGNEYNCTDAAISWMNAGGANFLNSSTGLFRNTPGTFGQALRAKSGANTTPGPGILGKGECN